MKLTKLILFSFIAAFVLGCVTTANYKKVLNTWVGTHIDSLVSSWGPPQGSYELSDGGSVIEYVKSSNAQVGGYTYTTPQTTYHSGTASSYGNYGGYTYGSYSGISTTNVQQQTPVYNIHMSCRTQFNVNNNGIITGWTMEGNACRARDPGNVEAVSLDGTYECRTNSDCGYGESCRSNKGGGTECRLRGAVEDVSDETQPEQSSSPDKQRSVKIAHEPIGLYAEPSESARRVGKIYKKSSLIVTDEDGDWIQVRIDNDGGTDSESEQTGWIMKDWTRSK